MAGTGAVVRRVKQQAVRADGMIPVMLYDSGLADQPCNDKWKKSWIRQMNDIGRPNIGQQGREPRSTDYPKRKDRVVHIAGGRIRDKRNVDYLVGVCFRP